MSSHHTHHTQHAQAAPSQKGKQTSTRKVRGPFLIEVLAKTVGISVDQVRSYREQGLIPQRRVWHPEKSAMFYKSDVDKIVCAQQKEKTQTAGNEKYEKTNNLLATFHNSRRTSTIPRQPRSHLTPRELANCNYRHPVPPLTPSVCRHPRKSV